MLIPSTLATWEQKMNDDTSFETHRQQETKDFILQLRRLIAEQEIEIEQLKALLARAAEMLETLGCKGPAVAELRKASR